MGVELSTSWRRHAIIFNGVSSPALAVMHLKREMFLQLGGSFFDHDISVLQEPFKAIRPI